MTTTIETKGKRLSSLSRPIEESLESGSDVILRFGDNASPERVLKILEFVHDTYHVEVVVRHAELREYLEHMVAGAAVGSAAGLGLSVYASLAAGNPISLGAVLAAAGIGAVIGATFGAGLTAVHCVTVYKYCGDTRLKIAAAA
jgi:hypothetical protein